MEKKKVYIIAKEHFDLVWRRCFERDFEFQGRNFVSYARLEELYIKDNIELCKKYPHYNFEIESVAVLQKFLERNPDYEQIIEEYIRDMRIYIPFSGINIVDSNMTNGESIVRNYLYGYNYMKDKYGYICEGVDRNDAFGNSAQLPQIIRKFGSKWVCHIAYSPCTSPYWRGIDGSIVYNMAPPCIGEHGGYRKYPPCPVCGGFGDETCEYCGGRGIDEPFLEKVKFYLRIREDEIEKSEIPGYVYAGGEEILPKDDIIKWAEENSDKYDIEFVSFKHYEQHYKTWLDKVDNPPEEEIFPSAECNPNNTGTYVSRIKIKQGVRRLENSIFAAEALSIASGKEYPAEAFKGVWEKALFTMFHDSLPATIVDPAYDEICDTIADAQQLVDEIIEEQSALVTEKKDDILTVFNPNGIAASAECTAVLPKDMVPEGVTLTDFKQNGENVTIKFEARDMNAYETRAYRLVHAPESFEREILFAATEQTASGEGILTNNPDREKEDTTENDVILENEFYRITAGNHGITEIFDKKLGKTVARESEYKIGEWILEHDEGSPWATISPDMRRQSLARNTKIICNEKTSDYHRVTFKFKPDVVSGYAVSGAVVVYSVTLAKNNDKIMFSADVDWDMQNHRFRIAFPTELSGRHIYEIPYGMIERKPYEPNIVYEDNSSNWASAAGDYPAINWAGIDDGCESIALFNKGTPSYQISSDSLGKQTMYLTVLRSPSVGTYLHTPLEYSMTDYDRMRDPGLHHFEYALKSYRGAFSENGVVVDGIAFNTRMLTFNGSIALRDMPQVLSGSARISAVIPSHDKQGLIIRVVEFAGKDSDLEIKIPDYVKSVCETDLKEDITAELSVSQGVIKTGIKHFEIKTLLLRT